MRCLVTSQAADDIMTTGDGLSSLMPAASIAHVRKRTSDTCKGRSLVCALSPGHLLLLQALGRCLGGRLDCLVKQELFPCFADVSNSRVLNIPAGLRAQGGGTMGAEVTRHVTSRTFSWKLRLVCISVLLISYVQHWIVPAEHCEVKAAL